MEAEGIFLKVVRHSWVKPNNFQQLKTIWICGTFKVTINSLLIMDNAYLELKTFLLILQGCSLGGKQEARTSSGTPL